MFEFFDETIKKIQDATAFITDANQIQPVGIGGYSLDARIQENVTYASDVPEHVVEDKATINDHIILKPITLTIEGQVSNLSVQESFKQAIDHLISDKTADILDVLYPNYRSSQTVQTINELEDAIRYGVVGQTYNKANSLYSYFSGTKEKEVINFLDFMLNLRASKLPIQVEALFKTYENMVLIEFKPELSNETIEAINFQATFKQINFAQTQLTQVQKLNKNPSSGVKNRVSQTKDQGVVTGQKQPRQSFFKVMLSMF